MSDLISRHAAIERIVSIRPSTPKQSDYSHGVDVGLAMAIVAITEQQSAQPERKKGKWFEVDPYMVICPFCKHASSRRNFCAECGADMRGESYD